MHLRPPCAICGDRERAAVEGLTTAASLLLVSAIAIAVALQQLMEQLGLEPDEVCYMGDDDIDVPALQLAGIGATVPTAMPEALDAADYITARAAGRGAVREICDFLLRTRPVPEVSRSR